MITTEDRLLSANPAPNINLRKEKMTHPIQFMQKYDYFEVLFNNIFKKAFHKDLILHRNAGSIVPFYVGTKPSLENGEDRVSESYFEKLEKLDLLHEQGDGMKSFVGILLNVILSFHSIILIDEPEAFLHPSQARLLGNQLLNQSTVMKQTFLSTHSEEFLNGLLEYKSDHLKIIRIERSEDVNKISILENHEITKIWNDSLLKHSNILRGLFYSSVIICESDSDCTFYSAILSEIIFIESKTIPDIMFIHCGGKHRMHVVIKALKSLNVRIKVITDFDILNDIDPLKYIYEELGGNWSDIENDWKIVRKEIEQKRPELVKDVLKNEIDKIFQANKENTFSKDSINGIKNLLKKASAWSVAKAIGKAFIPSGNATQAFERIQKYSENVGLNILEVGELEGFVKSVGNHGPKWVSEVLNRDLRDKEFETAKLFIKKVISSL